MKRRNPQKKELNEIEASNLSDIEFKVMVIRILKVLSENYISMKKDTETKNKNRKEMNNKISEIKNTLEGITSKLEDKVKKKNHPERARKGKEAQKKTKRG